jgi:glucokinase
MAVPMLKPEHLTQFGGGEPVEGKPIAVYGAGTGLGVSHLVHVDKRWVSLPGEGGHVDFAPNSEEEGIILEELRAEIGHVSAERVLSGPGLVNLYRAIVKSDGRLPENLQPKDVTERAWRIAVSIVAARCRCFASLWGVLAATWRSISVRLAVSISRAVSCRASWISLPPPVSAVVLKIKVVSNPTYRTSRSS